MISCMSDITHPHPHVVLIACSASKLDTREPVPARQLYTGQLFKLSLDYAEHVGALPFIVSAHRGLVLIDEPVITYDWSMNKMNMREREAWSLRTMSTLRTALRPRVPSRVEVLAPKLYAEGLYGQLRYQASEHQPSEQRWPEAEYPLKGLGIGEQKKKLRQAIDKLTLRAA